MKYNECIDIVSFLALQNHIATKSGDDLFFSKSYQERNGGSKYLLGLGWPETNYLGIDFRINLRWTGGNKYDSSSSYFGSARAYDIKRNNYDEENKKFNLSTIFESIGKIAISCFEKGYFAKSGITFKKQI